MKTDQIQNAVPALRAVSNDWKKGRRVFQSLELAAALLLSVSAARAVEPLMGTNEQYHLGRALSAMNMTVADLGFAKDHGEPRTCLPWIRTALGRPLDLPARADDIVAATAGGSTSLWQLAARSLELVVPLPPPGPEPKMQPMWQELDPKLANGLARFMAEATRADRLLRKAYARLSSGDMSYLGATVYAGVFNAEASEDTRRAMMSAGISSQDIERVIAEANALDPGLAATNIIALADRIDRVALFQAGQVFQAAVESLAATARQVEKWPQGNVLFATDLGRIRIGGEGNESYTDRALLILQRGGDTAYRRNAGVANGLVGQPLSAIIDLAGDDRYESGDLLGPGAALFGVSVIIDGAGNDSHISRYSGQASAAFGVSCLHDMAGADLYRAWGHAQAAADYGVAILRDDGGNDVYDAGVCAQAYAGCGGFALLLDGAGDDRYFAGNRERAWDLYPDHFHSLSQGFAIGMRPFAGGGVAALVDRAGNDNYIADIYGQGVSYWYSAAFLLDLAGNDTYQVYQYGQGSGIHLSLGLLADYAGDDIYTGNRLAQGQAHDYGVGMLFDHAGKDMYTGEDTSQGMGMNNGLGLLIDSAGDDAYFAKNTGTCQGIGTNGDSRDYGSLSLLLDLGGTDRYSCGLTNGAAIERPLYGVVYDAPAKGEVAR